MKKIALLLAVATMALTWIGPGAHSVLAQATGPDAIDPAFADGFTEAINNHDPDAVLRHFVEGGTVVFDNSIFGIPSRTMTAAEYATRQRPNQPDVPTDIRLEIADGSLQIGAARASWTWRETAGFLRDMSVDYIEFHVVATTENRLFKSISLAPTVESLAKLVSLAPSTESLVRLPYSPALPTLPFAASGDTGVSMGPALVVVRFESVGGSQAKGAAIVRGTAPDGGANVSLHVTGLTPGAPAQATLHAGTCVSPGASFAELPELTVDASGTGTATGPALFRGTESVALATVADGDHIISVGQSGRVVACGRVPAMEGLPPDVPGMPRTGDPIGQIALLLLVVASLGVVLVGVRMRRGRSADTTA